MCKRMTIFPIIALALLIQPLPLLSSPPPDFDGDGTVGFPDFFGLCGTLRSKPGAMKITKQSMIWMGMVP